MDFVDNELEDPALISTHVDRLIWKIDEASDKQYPDNVIILRPE